MWRKLKPLNLKDLENSYKDEWEKFPQMSLCFLFFWFIKMKKYLLLWDGGNLTDWTLHTISKGQPRTPCSWEGPKTFSIASETIYLYCLFAVLSAFQLPHTHCPAPCPGITEIRRALLAFWVQLPYQSAGHCPLSPDHKHATHSFPPLVSAISFFCLIPRSS